MSDTRADAESRIEELLETVGNVTHDAGAALAGLSAALEATRRRQDRAERERVLAELHAATLRSADRPVRSAEQRRADAAAAAELELARRRREVERRQAELDRRRREEEEARARLEAQAEQLLPGILGLRPLFVAGVSRHLARRVEAERERARVEAERREAARLERLRTGRRLAVILSDVFSAALPAAIEALDTRRAAERAAEEQRREEERARLAAEEAARQRARDAAAAQVAALRALFGTALRAATDLAGRHDRGGTGAGSDPPPAERSETPPDAETGETGGVSVGGSELPGAALSRLFVWAATAPAPAVPVDLEPDEGLANPTRPAPAAPEGADERSRSAAVAGLPVPSLVAIFLHAVGGSAAPPTRGERRSRERRRQRRRRWPAVALALGIAGAAAAGATAVTRSGNDRLTAAAPTSPFAVPGNDPNTSIVAHATVPLVEAYAEPDDAVPSFTFDHPTDFGGPAVFLVSDLSRAGWVKAHLPIRPNGTEGWIRSADLTLGVTDFRVVVELAAHRLSVWKGDDLEAAIDVGIGTRDTPTPGGAFYITELLQPPDPDTVYGTYAFGLSGFSNTLEKFAGGEGVIGIHGTNDPSGIGRDVSAGCIRMRNEDIDELVGLLPLGTPVEIRA